MSTSEGIIPDDGSGKVIACFNGDLGRVDVVDAIYCDTRLLNGCEFVLEGWRGRGNRFVGDGGVLGLLVPVLRLKASTELWTLPGFTVDGERLVDKYVLVHFSWVEVSFKAFLNATIGAIGPICEPSVPLWSRRHTALTCRRSTALATVCAHNFAASTTESHVEVGM